MSPETKKEMRTIWYFVGWMLLVVGGLIFVTGIYYMISPDRPHTVLQNLHPDVWWGGIMLISGILFLYFDRKLTRKSKLQESKD